MRLTGEEISPAKADRNRTRNHSRSRYPDCMAVNVSMKFDIGFFPFALFTAQICILPLCKMPVGSQLAENAENDFDYLFKVIVIGDSGVGKTAIVRRLKYNTFKERQPSTVGVDFTLKTIQVDDKRIKLQMWDTAGQERFRTMIQSYYRSANGVVLVYDISRKDSFVNIERWLEDVQRYAGTCMHKMLIGNKCDLDGYREISSREASKFADYYKIRDFVETSAKDKTNVDNAFWRMAKNLKDIYEDKQDRKDRKNPNNIVLESRTVSGSCCW